MTKIMPVHELICGERTCVTRSPRVADDETFAGLRLCKWYRGRGMDNLHASCILFETANLRKRSIGEHVFAVRCEKCLMAERQFVQVQTNVTAVVTQVHETMKDGLASLVEAQDRLGEVALAKGM